MSKMTFTIASLALILGLAACGRGDGDIKVNEIQALQCSYGSQVYEPGQKFTHPDGCNSCQCYPNGRILCTQKACGPSIGF